MYILKFDKDDDLANIKVGSRNALVDYALAFVASKGQDVDTYTCGDTTYLRQFGIDIGIIVPVIYIND